MIYRACKYAEGKKTGNNFTGWFIMDDFKTKKEALAHIKKCSVGRYRITKLVETVVLSLSKKI